MLGVRVDAAERKETAGEAQFLALAGDHAKERAIGLACVWTCVLAIDHQPGVGVLRTAHMVSGGDVTSRVVSAMIGPFPRCCLSSPGSTLPLHRFLDPPVRTCCHSVTADGELALPPGVRARAGRPVCRRG